MYWSIQSSPADNTWKSVCYGNGIFVAVADSGTNRVMTSPDGINWYLQTITYSTSMEFRRVCFGNGLFIASGAQYHIATSTNGIDWTIRHPPTSSLAINDICYGNNVFVGLVPGGAIDVIVSSNGIDWNTYATSSNITFTKICYGNNLFVAVGNSGSASDSRIMTSSNGINWTFQEHPDEYYFTDVFYGNNLFVATMYDESMEYAVLTSPDGSNWTPRNTPGNCWRSGSYGCGMYVIVGSGASGHRSMISPNGTTWSLINTPADNTWCAIFFADNIFVAVASSGTGNRVMTATIENDSLYNIAGIKIIHNPIIGFKIETNPFVTETLTSSDYKYSVNPDIKINVDIESYNQNIASGGFSDFPSIAGKRMCAVNFSIDLYSKSTLTTAPTYYDILQACGWKQTSITNGLAILPDSSKNRVPATIEVSFPEEGILPRQLVYKISGAVGNVKFDGENYPVKLEFSFIGRLESITTRGADSIITPVTFDAEVPSPVLSGTFTLLDNILPLRSFTVSSNEVVELFTNIMNKSGYDGARITDRYSFGTVDIAYTDDTFSPDIDELI